MRVRIAEMAYRKKGWTMRQVSEHLSVDHQTVMYWNQGRSLPRLPMLMRLCRLLGCGLDDLIEDDPFEEERESEEASTETGPQADLGFGT